MILLREGMAVIPLEQSGVPLERRFAFYDQCHTTGMDIKQTSTAVAVVTVGKGEFFMYRYISRESCSQFDSLP